LSKILDYLISSILDSEIFINCYIFVQKNIYDIIFILFYMRLKSNSLPISVDEHCNHTMWTATK